MDYKTKQHEEFYKADLKLYDLELDPYSLEGSLNYDQEASFMSDRYKEAHSIQNSVITNMLDHTESSVVLDFGCGTGSDGLEILLNNLNIKYVGLDSSAYMLNIASNKFKANRLTSRSVLLNRDFRHLTTDSILTEFDLLNISHQINCIISSLVLHHYDTITRSKFYMLVKQLLKNNGFFILTDLFSNSIDFCNQMALEREVGDISGAVSRINSFGLSQFRGTTLSKNHYININRPSSLLQEIKLLFENGFIDQDIIYRSGQLGVIILKKEGK